MFNNQAKVVRHIQKSVFNKIISKPNHFLYSRVVHEYIDSENHYYISRDINDGPITLIFSDLPISLDNDLYERSCN